MRQAGFADTGKFAASQSRVALKDLGPEERGFLRRRLTRFHVVDTVGCRFFGRDAKITRQLRHLFILRRADVPAQIVCAPIDVNGFAFPADFWPGLEHDGLVTSLFQGSSNRQSGGAATDDTYSF
jgi:hypothetical protein